MASQRVRWWKAKPSAAPTPAPIATDGPSLFLRSGIVFGPTPGFDVHPILQQPVPPTLVHTGKVLDTMTFASAAPGKQSLMPPPLCRGCGNPKIPSRLLIVQIPLGNQCLYCMLRAFIHRSVNRPRKLSGPLSSAPNTYDRTIYDTLSRYKTGRA
jgi:hypothetical protein